MARAPMPADGEHVTPAGLDRTSFRAMGTDVVVLAPAASLPGATAIVRAVVATWEQACSRFRADSELARLNAAAG